MTSEPGTNVHRPTRRARPRYGLSLLLVLALLAPTPLSAQAPAGSQPKATESKAAPPSGAQVRAREAYAAGVSAFQRGEYAHARERFATADTEYPSPNVKLMLGRSLALLDRPVEAFGVLRATLREAREDTTGKYTQAEESAGAELQKLLQRLALIRLSVEDPEGQASLRVAGREIVRESWLDPVAAEPGAVAVELSAADGRRDAKQLELRAGTSATITLKLPPLVPPPPAAPVAATRSSDDGASSVLRPISYVAAGLGVAGMVGFGVFGAMSNSEFASLKESCPDRTRCDARFASHADDGRTYQTLANISLGVGVTTLVAGVVLWVVSLPSDDKPPLRASWRGAELTGTF